LVVVNLVWQLHWTDVGEWDAGFLGLQAVEGPRTLRPSEKGSSGGRSVGICAIALCVVSRATIRTVTACDGGRNHYAIPRGEIPRSAADFFNNAHTFMSENGAFLHSRNSAANQVEVGAANGACGQRHDGVSGVFDFGFFYVF
jgi:hypothetical protein